MINTFNVIGENKVIEEVKKEVSKLLDKDNSGHGMEHINRVLNLSLNLINDEKVNKDIVMLIALLHDVDDYKLFGIKNANNLSNANNILNNLKVNDEVKIKVLEGINAIGYSKRLEGIKPSFKEAMIVSDADMLDALGVSGILRTYKYSMKMNRPFFDKNIFPVENFDSKTYMNNNDTCGVCHFFEKILRLKDMMLTESGKKLAIKKHDIVVKFLYDFFEEENAIEWTMYLDEYLKK